MAQGFSLPYPERRLLARSRPRGSAVAFVLLAVLLTEPAQATRADGGRRLLKAPQAAETRVELVLLARREVLAELLTPFIRKQL